MAGYNQDYLLNTPQFWGSNLPQPGDFKTASDYLAAVQAAYNGDPNQSAPQYAAPSTFAGPDGQQWSAAGTTSKNSAGLNAANEYNRMMDLARRGNPGPGVGLIAASRMAVRPEEAQQAYNAYDLSPSGLPERLLNDYMTNLMEAAGTRPTNLPGESGVDKLRTQAQGAKKLGPGDFPTMPTQGDFYGRPPIMTQGPGTFGPGSPLAALLLAAQGGVPVGNAPGMPTQGDFAGQPPVMQQPPSSGGGMGQSPNDKYGPQAQFKNHLKPAGY